MPLSSTSTSTTTTASPPPVPLSSTFPYTTPTLHPPSLVGTHSRQLLLPPPFNTLPSGVAIIIGLGGLGTPLLTYLSRLSPNLKLVLIDGDAIEASNLHRQICYSSADIGRKKVDVAKEYVERMTPGVEVVTIPEFIREDNIGSILSPLLSSHNDGSNEAAAKTPVVIFSCLDSHAPRVLLAKHAHDNHPSAAIVSGCASGLTGTALATPGCCYGCAIQGEGTNCSDVGVLPSVLAVIAGVMVELSFPFWSGRGGAEGVRVYEAGTMRRFKVGRRPGCTVCGEGDDTATSCSAATSDGFEGLHMVNIDEALSMQRDGWEIVDVRSPSERDVSILKGARDAAAPDWRAIFVCRSGIRAVAACRRHVEAGGEGVVLEGGMRRVKERWSDMPLI